MILCQGIVGNPAISVSYLSARSDKSVDLGKNRGRSQKIPFPGSPLLYPEILEDSNDQRNVQKLNIVHAPVI